VVLEVGRVDHVRDGELVLDVRDAAFDEPLALLGGIVLGVLGEVAVRARLGERPAHVRPVDRLQPLQLGLQALRALDRHRYFLHRRSSKETGSGSAAPAGWGRLR
jgi:hypothetical protein